MAREIAVFIDELGQTADFGQPGRVRVYRRWRKAWTAERETAFALDAAGGLKGLRRQLAELLVFLGECRVFVARTITGVPYFELEKAGFNIWEQAGDPQGYLETVWEREEEERAAESEALPAAAPAPVRPEEKSPGHYFISLKEVQSKNAGVTSKQVLQPFLRQGRFTLLEVVCDHLPPWLEVDLASGAYSWTSERVNEKETRVMIRR